MQSAERSDGMKNMYEMLNEIETNPEEYEMQEFSEFEAKKWQQKMKKQVHKRRSRKYITAAACAVLCIGALALGPFRQQVGAALDSATKALNFWLTWGVAETNIAPYENVVHTSVTSDEIEVELESVIMDGRELLVSTVQTYPAPMIEEFQHKLENGVTWNYWTEMESFDQVRKQMKEQGDSLEYPWLMANVSVDGRKLTGDEIVDPVEGEGNKLRVIYQFLIDETEPLDLEKEVEMKIEFEEMTGASDGTWDFTFTADGKGIRAHTTTVPLNQKVQLPNGKEILLTEYKHNELGAYIYYEGDKNVEYLMQLRGENDRRELVWFYDSSIGAEQVGRFALPPRDTVRMSEMKSVTLSLYCHEIPDNGEVAKDGNYKVCGEPFTLDLQADKK